MKKILVIGYNKNETKLYKLILKKFKNIKLINSKKKPILNFFRKFDLIISFGYRHIINKDIIKKLERPIINLHMSYLPFNRGAHPNFWSFMEKTPSGVTLHEIDTGIDTGKIIVRKKRYFNLKKNSKLTFKRTYKILFEELEKLLIENLNKLISGNYKCHKQLGKGTFHLKSDLPTKVLKKWNQNIDKTILKYKDYHRNEKI
tara:strand:+ start:166 stop:771 length:606 start_codon:yes stop_codon:yes gene_type:complete